MNLKAIAFFMVAFFMVDTMLLQYFALDQARSSEDGPPAALRRSCQASRQAAFFARLAQANPEKDLQSLEPLLASSRTPASKNFDPDGGFACLNAEEFGACDSKKLAIYRPKTNGRRDLHSWDFSGRESRYPDACGQTSRDFIYCRYRNGYLLEIRLRSARKVPGRKRISFYAEMEGCGSWGGNADDFKCFAKSLD